MLQGAGESHRLAPGLSFGAPAVHWPPPPPSPAALAAGGTGGGTGGAFPGLTSLALRYFNASGAHPAAGLGEVHDPETHLIPRALAAALAPRHGGAAALTVNGDDYPTPDGTCVRDYVHVLDLADAHVAGIEHLLDGGGSDAVNLGSGSGYSIREVVSAIEQATGEAFPVRIGPRRPGDTASLVADIGKAGRLLAWRPRRDLGEIVASAAAFHRRHGFT
jgi:UDP-glucose 4-epimerase